MAEVNSAGLLMFVNNKEGLKVFLVHPGGPFFTKKDEGYWGIPKGLPEENEDFLEAAKREFEEETGLRSNGSYLPLGTVKQKGGKIVHAWAFETKSADPIEIKCNTFNLEWPPKSKNIQAFPEVDKGEFFSVEEALEKINTAQSEFIFRLQKELQK